MATPEENGTAGNFLVAMFIVAIVWIVGVSLVIGYQMMMGTTHATGNDQQHPIRELR